jgi:hypothetical protein
MSADSRSWNDTAELLYWQQEYEAQQIEAEKERRLTVDDELLYQQMEAEDSEPTPGSQRRYGATLEILATSNRSELAEVIARLQAAYDAAKEHRGPGRPTGIAIDGEKVRQARLALGLTQEGLAVEDILPARMVQRLEAGGTFDARTVAILMTELNRHRQERGWTVDLGLAFFKILP